MSPAPLTAKWSVDLGFSFDTHVGNNFELFRNAVRNQDWDCCGIVDGKEGSGKSVYAQQLAFFFNHERRIDLDTQIHFTADDVRRAIRTLPKNTAIIWDEAGEGTDRRESVKDTNIEFNKMLKKARQYNQFLILVLPSFYDMDQFPAVWRTRYLVHVYYKWDVNDRETPLSRGYARLYNEDGKKELYTDKILRQRYKYPYLKNKSFDFKFPKHYLVDEEAYKRKKLAAEEAHEAAYEKRNIRCPECHSKDLRFNRTNNEYTCRKCPWGGELTRVTVL